MFRGAGGSPGEGPYIELELEITNGRVGAGSFKCNGCPPAQQAACVALAFAKGRQTSQLEKLEPHDLELLGGPLPEGKGYYYDLALKALLACIAASNATQYEE